MQRFLSNATLDTLLIMPLGSSFALAALCRYLDHARMSFRDSDASTYVFLGEKGLVTYQGRRAGASSPETSVRVHGSAHLGAHLPPYLRGALPHARWRSLHPAGVARATRTWRQFATTCTSTTSTSRPKSVSLAPAITSRSLPARPTERLPQVALLDTLEMSNGDTYCSSCCCSIIQRASCSNYQDDSTSTKSHGKPNEYLA